MNFTDFNSIVIEEGILIQPNLHDAEIVSFSKFMFGTPSEFEVILKSVNDELWKMKVDGIKYFMCQNIQQQNVIFEIEVVSGTELKIKMEIYNCDRK